jgi:hypothetical protein
MIQEEEEEDSSEVSVTNNANPIQNNTTAQNARNRVEEARRLIQVPARASAQVLNFAHMWR